MLTIKDPTDGIYRNALETLTRTNLQEMDVSPLFSALDMQKADPFLTTDDFPLCAEAMYASCSDMEQEALADDNFVIMEEIWQ